MFWKRYLLGAALAVMSLQTLAAAPQVKTPAPGFYRIMLGSYEVTALSDGVLRLPVDSAAQQFAKADRGRSGRAPSGPAGRHLC